MEQKPEAVAPTDQLGAWVQCAERLPELDVPVWLYLPDGSRIIHGCRSDVGDDSWGWCNCYGGAYFSGDKWKCDSAEYDDDYQPTLWQPLPEPPRYTQAELDAAAQSARELVASLRGE